MQRLYDTALELLGERRKEELALGEIVYDHTKDEMIVGLGDGKYETYLSKSSFREIDVQISKLNRVIPLLNKAINRAAKSFNMHEAKRLTHDINYRDLLRDLHAILRATEDN